MNKEQRKEWRKCNPEKHRKEQRLYYSINKNKVKLRVKNSRELYRERRKGREQGSYYSASEWFTLCFAVGFKCVCCGEQGTVESLTPDHVVPLSAGGSNYAYNIQPMCLRCNMAKHTKIVDYRILPEWAIDLRGCVNALSVFVLSPNTFCIENPRS